MELLTYLGQYMTLQSKLGCKSLKEMQSQMVGVSGVTLAGSGSASVHTGFFVMA